MKKLVTLFVLIAAAVQAQDGYRTFTAGDGRTLEAKLISYDSNSGKTTIERKDRKRITVAATAFSEKDQRHIAKWAAGQIFLSESKLKLDLERDEVKSTKTDLTINLEDYSNMRGGSGTRNVGTDKKTQYRFLLSLSNTGGLPLERISMDYRIYYSQEKAVKDKEKSEAQADDRPDIYEAVEQQKVREERGTIKLIEPRATKEVATKSVTVLNRTVSGRGIESRINLEGELHGVWIRLTMKGPDNEKLVREIAYPPSIPKKFPWNADEEQVVQ